MRRIYALIAGIVALIAIIWFVMKPKTAVVPPTEAEASPTVSHYIVGEIPETPASMYMGEQVVPTSSPRIVDNTQPLVLEPVSKTAAAVVISGSKLTTGANNTLIASGGYYDGDSIEIKKIGENLVAIATTETGASVGVPTSTALIGLEREAGGKFIYSGTPEQIAAQKQAAQEFQDSLCDPAIQSKIPGVYTYGDYKLWNGANANNGVYQNFYGEIPYTLEYQLAVANPLKTAADLEEIKTRSRAEMKRVLTTQARARPTEIAMWGVSS